MSDLPKKAEIRYLMPDGTRPIYIASDGGANAALNIQAKFENITVELFNACLLYTSPSPRDATLSRMPSSA